MGSDTRTGSIPVCGIYKSLKKRMYNHIHEGGDVMGWIIIISILAISIYGIVKLIKWVTAPSYWHKYSGGYYINGRKELSQKDKKKIKELQRKW